MTLIDEVIGYAKANALAASGTDRETWAAHERNCLRVKAEIERLNAYQDKTAMAWTKLTESQEREIARLRAALEKCAGACYLDDHDLEYKPTREALIAQRALAPAGEKP